MMPKFKNKNGDFTLYALTCGNVEEEKYEIGDSYWKKQLYVEHSHIHVETIIKEKGENNFKDRVCKVFEINELTKARVFYKSLKPCFSSRSKFQFKAMYSGLMYALDFYDCDSFGFNECKKHVEKWKGGKVNKFSMWDLKMQ